MKKILLLLIVAFVAIIKMDAQVTTSNMRGKVVDTKGEELIGATVLATHVPTGAQYGTTTREDGRYNINNLNPGGPYKIEISYLGYQSIITENIFLNLGEDFRYDGTLSNESKVLDEVVINADKSFNNSRTGAETNIDNKTINALPTVSRSLSDFTRVTPQAKIDNNGAISISGQNNRYNAISIDGAQSNDVFGLSASGTNGGQTGISPISVDAIESFKVIISPYDVTQSGFTGGGINATTRSGTNDIKASAYYFLRNENLTGKTPTLSDTSTLPRTKLADFTAKTYGVRVGGPIIKNKLFFFVNGEIQREERPSIFNGVYTGATKAEGLASLRKFMLEKYNYETGDYLQNVREVNSDKISARLDYNLNKSHKLSFSHRYTYGESISPSNSGSQTINFANGGIFFPSTTNSTSLELKSVFGSQASNSLLFGYTTVRDDRDPIGSDLPGISIIDGTGRINIGSEAFSSANQLNSNILTFLNKFQYYKGKNSITAGIDGEIGSFYNLFIRQNYGVYQYGSLTDFYNDNPNRYDRSYSLVDNLSGDGSKAAAEFTFQRFGAFVSDKFDVTDRFSLTGGIRLDYNLFPDQPPVSGAALDYWNNIAKPVIAATYDLKGAEAGKMPSGQINISPRLGFNLDVSGDQTLQIRGGSGIFFGRIPMVWPGGVYTNSGALIGGIGLNRPTAGWGANIPRFVADVNKQYDAAFFNQTVSIPSGEINLISSDFKLPSVWRSSLGIDKKFANNLKVGVEFMYSKNRNDIYYENVNIQKPTGTTAGADKRNIYTPTATNPNRLDFVSTTTGIQNQYANNVFLMSNGDINGNSWNFTGQVEKTWFSGLFTSLAYTFGESKILSEATSSQNSSQWRFMESVNGRNNQELSYSDFDLGHRIVGLMTLSTNYFKSIGGTSLTLFYNGQSGNRFSYVYNRSITNDWSRTESNDLIFVPATKDQISFTNAATADAQWTALNKFLSEDDYLSTRRGQYAERNGARTPFTSIFDIKLVQDININVGKKKNNLQLTFDVFNVGNLLSKNWGRQFFLANDNFRLMTFDNFKNAATGDFTPTFTFNAPNTVWSVSDGAFNSSRWSSQLGIRYTFE